MASIGSSRPYRIALLRAIPSTSLTHCHYLEQTIRFFREAEVQVTVLESTMHSISALEQHPYDIMGYTNMLAVVRFSSFILVPYFFQVYTLCSVLVQDPVEEGRRM